MSNSGFRESPGVSLEDVTFAHVEARGDEAKSSIPLLRNFSLHCEAGKISAILGESGCGKSTMLDLIAGLHAPKSGRVIRSSPGALEEPRIGFIFQKQNSLPWLRVEDNVAFGMRTFDAKRVDGVLDDVELDGLRRHFPSQLSGGQGQLIAIGRLLLRDADLVLCDEPLSSLDIYNRRRLERMVEDAIRRVNATGIIVTHEPEQALRMADEVFVLGQRPLEVLLSVKVDRDLREDPVLREVFEQYYLSILDTLNDEEAEFQMPETPTALRTRVHLAPFARTPGS